MESSWFQIDRVQPHLIVIRESLEKIDSRFLTNYTNMYLILGSHSAILFDTGSGSRKLKPQIDEILENRTLYTINSHSHFDHLGSNYEFDKIYVHVMDLKVTANQIDVSFLQTSNSSDLGILKANLFKINPSKEIIPLIGEEEFDLGGLKVQVIYTPGHTSGSICLLTDRNELFSGDTFHNGAYYLPPYERYQSLIDSFSELNQKITKTTIIYPAHEDFPLSSMEIKNFENILRTTNFNDDHKTYDEFLEAFIMQVDHFKLVYSREGYVDSVDWY